MREFLKWLGVNEKIAKVVVWMFIIVIMIISTNMLLESVGLPYYKITYDNVAVGTYSPLLSILLNCLINILNFYTITLLVFRIEKIKNMFKYALMYMILSYIIMAVFGYIALQIFIAAYIIGFCYFYSGKNWKYALYGIGALVFDVLLQTVWYNYKARFIDYNAIDGVTRSILTIDYFIIMGIVILVKEIYLKKRRDKLCGEADLEVGSGLELSQKKEKSLTKLQKELQKGQNNKNA